MVPERLFERLIFGVVHNVQNKFIYSGVDVVKTKFFKGKILKSRLSELPYSAFCEAKLENSEDYKTSYKIHTQKNTFLGCLHSIFNIKL